MARLNENACRPNVPQNPQRRDLLRSAGGLALGFAFGPNLLFKVFDARACEDGLKANAWVHFRPDNTIGIMCPTAEMGQGIMTSLPLVLAEELDADWSLVDVEQAPAAKDYINPGYFGVQGVGGSNSTRGYWTIMRLAGAQARKIMLANAAQFWSVPVAECTTGPSKVMHAASKRELSYGEIAVFSEVVNNPPTVSEKDLKPREQWRLIGRDVQRVDVPAKVNGSAQYGIDVQIPGMLFASLARSPIANTPHPLYGTGGENGPVSYNDSEAMKIQGVVAVIKLDHAVAVLGTDYWATVKGKRALKVEWRKGELASKYDSEAKKTEWAAIARDRSKTGRAVGNAGDFGAAFKQAAQTVSAEYLTDHVHHACMEPFNATAWVRGTEVDVWVPTQGQTWAQQVCAKITGVPAEEIRINTTFVGGGYGAKTEQLMTAEAVTLSKMMNKPVKVIWSREDDVKHGAYRPLTAQRMDAAIAADGKVTAWSHRLVADSVLVRARKVVWDQNPGLDGSVAVGMLQPYGVPNKHHEYVHQLGGVPVGYWNAVGNGFTIFAVESFMDEVAAKIKKDPLQLRSELMTDARGRVVLERLRKLSEWDRPRGDGRALGVAYNHGGAWNCQIGEVVEVSVDRASGAIKVHKVWAVADPGTAIQPKHLRQQLETGIIWGMSAGLREQVVIKSGEVQQSNFYDYPVPRMDEMPEIEIHLVEGAQGQVSGAGQIGVAPMAPAIANAVFKLTGVRMRELPMLPVRVMTAMNEQAVKTA